MNSSLKFFSFVFTAKSFISRRLKLRNISPHKIFWLVCKTSFQMEQCGRTAGSSGANRLTTGWSEPCVLSSGIRWTSSPSSAPLLLLFTLLPSSWQLQQSSSYYNLGYLAGEQQQSVGSGPGSGSDPPVFAAGHGNISLSLCSLLLVLLFQQLSVPSTQT